MRMVPRRPEGCASGGLMTDGPVQVNAEGALALAGLIPDIAGGRLARDVSLANRVRSGRKQP